MPVGGMVFGMSNTVVTPPKAAAAVPLAKSSFVRIADHNNVHIDRAWQYMHAARIKHLGAPPASPRRHRPQ